MNQPPTIALMKILPLPLSRPLTLASLVFLGAVALPTAAHAKPDKKGKSSQYENHYGKGNDGHDHDHDHDRDERVRHYHSLPRTTFSLNLGNGYAGRGYYYGPPNYYYGPPNVPYYYERPEVRYYRTRELAPREYWGSGYSNRISVESSVQRALARQGYYHAGIDGEIGPYSRSCIARYQADHGLRPTGLITPSLLRSLGLE